MFVCNYGRKEFVDDHKQKYAELKKIVLGLKSQTNVCDFYRQNICSVESVAVQCAVVNFLSSFDQNSKRANIQTLNRDLKL